MKIPVRIILSWYDCSCRFTIEDIIFEVAPSENDCITFVIDETAQTPYFVVSVGHILHLISDVESTCYVDCQPMRYDTEYEMVEAFDLLKSHFGDRLVDVDGDRRPPKYYRLYRTVKRLWSERVIYDNHNVMIVAEMVRGILIAQTGMESDDLHAYIEMFANAIIAEHTKTHDDEIPLLKIVASNEWPDCEYDVGDDIVDLRVASVLNKLAILDKSKLPQSLARML